MKLPLTYFGNPVLRKKASPIGEITDEIHRLAENMIETMREANGVGLAAPQVGVLHRIFVIQDMQLGVDGTVTDCPPEVILNPSFSDPTAELDTMEEGCLSIPGLYLDVTRPKGIRVRYQKLSGEWREEMLQGFRARVFMHENDHINGVLFIDRIPDKERKRVQPILQEIKRKYG